MGARFETVHDDRSGGPGPVIAGRLDAEGVAEIWRESAAGIESLAKGSEPSIVLLDASGVDYCDGAGAALLTHLERVASTAGCELRVVCLAPRYEELRRLHDAGSDASPPARPRPGFVVQVGMATVRTVRDLRELVAFTGEMALATLSAIRRPRTVRGRDVLQVAEAAGADALPIVALVSFLMGLIMAAQAAVQMRQYGAEIYIADLISLSMLKELGPLVTAIILAGRTGSAFAAELGTMKVNEEIDALSTMGLDPVRFLVVPRVLAAVAVTPLLSIFANLAGLAGGASVFVSFGYPLSTFVSRATAAVDLPDLLGALFKAFVYGILVAGIGGLRGLQTGSGARAVGESTTSAVVSGIVLIAIASGIFSLVYTTLGI